MARELRHGREVDRRGDAGRQSGVFQGGLLPPGVSVGDGGASGGRAEMRGRAEWVEQEPGRGG